MPIYIDFHAKMPSLPPETVEMLRREFESGKIDQFGVKGVNAYFTKAGAAYCVNEAPNVDAVCKSHQAKGLALDKGDVSELSSTLL